MRHLWIAGLMLACNGDAKDPDDVTETDVDAVDTETTDEDTDDSVDTPDEPDANAATLSGVLRDEAGELLTADVRVQYCRNTECRAGEVIDSTFTIERLDPGPGSFEVLALDEDSNLATVFAPLNLDPGQERSVDVTVPELDIRTALPTDRTEIEVSDGVYVTVSAGELENENPFAPIPTHIGATNVTDIGLDIDGLSDGSVEALYYMVPFDFHSSEGMEIRIRNDWSFADGEAALYAAVYTSFSWELIDDLKLDTNGDLVTNSGATLPLVTTIAVVRKN